MNDVQDAPKILQALKSFGCPGQDLWLVQTRQKKKT